MGKVVLSERAHPPGWSCLNNLLNQKETDNTANVVPLFFSCAPSGVIYSVLASTEEGGGVDLLLNLFINIIRKFFLK